MISRAKASVFWPGITPAHVIKAARTQCLHYHQIQEPQQLPLYHQNTPSRVFADFFHHRGNSYLVIVDRYSNCPISEMASNEALRLISSLHRTFVTFGIPNELASDGGPEFTATATRQFLEEWDVHVRLSSVPFPHGNCRAEVGVKTVKRLISDSSTPSGDKDTNSFQRAMLQYRNTPDRDTKLSPAMCVFGHPIWDFISIPPGPGFWKDV